MKYFLASQRILRNKSVLLLVSLFFAFGCGQLKENLSGGREWVVQVMVDYGVKREVQYDMFRLIEKMKEKNLPVQVTQASLPQAIKITGIKEEDRKIITDILADYFTSWNYTLTSEEVLMELKPMVVADLKNAIVAQALEVLKSRLSQLDLNEKNIIQDPQHPDQLIIRVPPVMTKIGGQANPYAGNTKEIDLQESTQQIESILKQGILELKPVVAGPFNSEEEALKSQNGTLNAGLEILRENPRTSDGGYYILGVQPVVDGRDIKKAKVGQDTYGSPAVSLTFTPQGGRILEVFSRQNIGKRLAIVFDGRIISAPVVQGIISVDVIITGRFTIPEVKDLVVILNSGGLPAPVKILSVMPIK